MIGFNLGTFSNSKDIFRCRIGLILGTGTNACYLEDIQVIFTKIKFGLMATFELKCKSSIIDSVNFKEVTTVDTEGESR